MMEQTIEIYETNQEVRTDAQEGKSTAYDVGNKIGGARKDEHALKEQFQAKRTVSHLKALEENSHVAAAEMITRDTLFDDFSLEGEKEKGTLPAVAKFKKLVINRMDKQPKDDPSYRRGYLKATTYVKEQLESLSEKDDIKTFIQSMNSKLYYLSCSSFTPAISRAIERRDQAKEENNEGQLTFYNKRIARLKESQKERMEAQELQLMTLGSSFVNMFMKKASMKSTLSNCWNIEDWEELLQKRSGTKRKSAKPAWERQLPEQPVRSGRMPFYFEKPEHLRKLYNFYGVEFGHYITDEEALMHISRSAEGLYDMWEMLNLPNIDDMSLDGTLSLAFGARGRGRALGHYEPKFRVINFTRKKGSLGILAHEWFHAFDHFIASRAKNYSEGQVSYLSENTTELKDHLPSNVCQAMEKILETIVTMESVVEIPNDNEKLTEDDRHCTKWRIPSRYKNWYEQKGQDVQAVLHQVKTEKELRYPGSTTRQRNKREKELRKSAQALAWYHEYRTGEHLDMIAMPVNESEFYRKALVLDKGQKGKYWSSHREMLARLFEAWIQDEIQKQGIQSDYLVCGANDGIAYPSGKERERLNKEMATLWMAIRRDVYEKQD